MGNQPPTSGKPPSSRYFIRARGKGLRDSKIYRVLGYFPGRSPDVDSLGFTFSNCRSIFLNLSLCDLGTCMLVCKEWRSLIDTCEFWASYVTRHYDNRVTEPNPHSVLYWWKYEQTPEAADDVTAEQPDKPHAFVFRPFPDLWRNGIVVPHGLRQATGSVDLYHEYISCLDSLRHLAVLVDQCGFSNIVHVCLFRWNNRFRKPTPADVMNALSAHALLTRDAEMNSGRQGEDEDEDDLSRILPPQGVDYEGQTNFIDIFTRCFQLGTREWIVAFQCSKRMLEPAPGFILTLMAPGWVGGLLYAT